MSTTTAPQKPTRPPLHRRLSPQVLLLVVVLILPLGWITYTFLKLQLGSGIEQVGDYKEVNLKAMGNFSFDDIAGSEADVPSIYRGLDGQKVLLVGEMYSDMVASDSTDNFQLVYSIAKCCFGGPPKVQERVFAKTPPGKRVFVISGLVKAYGTLHVRAIRENGKVVSLYDMEVERIVPYE